MTIRENFFFYRYRIYSTRCVSGITVKRYNKEIVSSRNIVETNELCVILIFTSIFHRFNYYDVIAECRLTASRNQSTSRLTTLLLGRL